MTSRLRFFLIPALLTAAALALGACGSAGHGDGVASLAGSVSAAPSASASGDPETQLNTYLECLRKQGVDLPDATVDAKGQVSFGRPADGRPIDQDKLQAAMKVCGDLPAGLTGGLNLDDPKLQDAAVKFAECMRGQGIDVPDPDLSKIGKDGGAFGKLDRDDPKTAAAIKVCQKVFTDAGINLGGGN